MFDTITLNGQTLARNTLKEYGREKLNSPLTPGWEKDLYTFINELINDQDYIVTQSSGTTGMPKSIRLTKKALIASALRTERYFNLKPGEHALLCLPVHYIAGKMMVVRAFVTGLNLWLIEPTSHPFREFTGPPLDFVALTPHQLAHSAESLRRQRPPVKQVIAGGAPIPPSLLGDIQTLPCMVYETYGMTETCSHIAIKPLNGPAATADFKVLEGFKVQTDERQCLQVRLTGNRPVEMIQTNDMVEFTNDGFKWLGRYDHVINSGGIKLFPEQIESKLSGSLPFPFAFTAKDDNKLGEKLILAIETAKPKESALVSIQNMLTEKLSQLEKPKELAILKAFPRTESGKLKRKALRDLLNQSSNVYFVALNK